MEGTSLCTSAIVPRRWLPTGLACIAVALLLGACGGMSGPDYEQPQTPQKDSWSGAESDVSAIDTIRPEWWRDFNDPFLDELIAQAIANNQDLQVLAARTSVAEASISQARATRLPTVDAALGANYTKTQGVGANTQTSYAGAVAWEADIWGKLKKGVKAQEAGFQASDADWRAGYLTLVSDVATTYFQIRQFDEQIDQQAWAVEQNAAIEAIYKNQYAEGMVPKTQVMQQEAEVSRLRKDLLELQRLRELSENALATLLGIPAGELTIPSEHLSDAVSIMPVPAGLPSDLLNKRPDIIAAQYRILQAFELEGQASLARLPSVSLTSNVGNTSSDLANLLNLWTLGVTPSVSIPIFDPGVNARYKVSQAESDLAEAEYRAVVMRAFEEVENALTNLSNHKLQQDELELQSEKLDVVATQVQARLEEGMVTQLEVFEAERSRLNARQQLLANHQLILSDTVQLYKALGGGWPAVYVGQND